MGIIRVQIHAADTDGALSRVELRRLAGFRSGDAGLPWTSVIVSRSAGSFPADQVL